MARKMDYKPTRFGLENSDAIEENDRIIEAGRQQRQENREKRESGEAAASVPTMPSSDTPGTDTPIASATTDAEIPTNTEDIPDNNLII